MHSVAEKSLCCRREQKPDYFGSNVILLLTKRLFGSIIYTNKRSQYANVVMINMVVEEYELTKEMTLTEFSKFCADMSPVNITFDSEGQTWFSGNTNVLLRFSKVVAILCPDELCFLSGDGCFCLRRIKNIKVSPLKQGVGNKAVVTCVMYGNDEEVDYTFVIDAA